ncbi:hypothetical protein [Natronorarus salvus]|uniref:hypothetical protein n=1 Tax=Natronorarus salvus TaxID=3117733 RepID=UPI002F26397E
MSPEERKNSGRASATRRWTLRATGAALASSAVAAPAAASSVCPWIIDDSDDSDEDSSSGGGGGGNGSSSEDTSGNDGDAEAEEEAPSEPESSGGDVAFDAEEIDVTAHGVDNSGNSSVTGALQRLAQNNRILYFPAGEYYMDSAVRFVGFQNFGLIAADGARFVPAPASSYNAPGQSVNMFTLGVPNSPGRNLHVENLTFDFSANNTGVRGLHASISDGLVVRDVEVTGTHDTGTFGPLNTDIVSSGGSGVIENLSLPDGAVHNDHTSSRLHTTGMGPSGLNVTRHHTGTLTVRNAEINGFPDNGLYAATRSGTVHVRGGTFRNNNVANVRLMGQGSSVEGASITVDRSPPGFDAQRAIRLNRGRNLEVRDVDVSVSTFVHDVIRVMPGTDSATIDDVSMNIPGANWGVTVTSGASNVNVGDLDVSGANRGDEYRY